MNSLRFVSLGSTLTLALLAGAQAQDVQRIEVTGAAQTAPGRYTDAGEVFVPFANPRTRAEVMAEAAASRANGEYVLEGDALVFRAATPTMTAGRR